MRKARYIFPFNKLVINSLLFRIGLIFFISLFCSLFGQLSYAQEISFNGNIAPIIYSHCTSCHRQGQPAPFPLESYHDVFSKQKLIRYVIENQIMPPWKTDSSYTHFSNERIMNKEEIKMIFKWMSQGMKEGKPDKKPSLPDFSKISDLGKYDYQIKFKKQFVLNGNNKQVFAWIKIPFEFDTDSEFVNVKSIEFIPGNAKLVHHMEIDLFSIPKDVDITEGTDTFTLSGSRTYQLTNLFPRAQDFNISQIYRESWAPGVSPQCFGEDVGIRLPRKGFAVVNMHYSASPINDSDDSCFNLYFQKNPVHRIVRYFNIGSHATTVRPKFIIPADSIKTFYSKIKISEDLSLLYISPHMHLLGQSFLSYAVTPSKDTIPLIKINSWDYNWQEFYRLDPAIKIPAASNIFIQGTFDNTSNNTRNPYHPPKNIDSEMKYAMLTNEEMLNLFVIGMPYQAGDEQKKWSRPKYRFGK